MDIFQDLLLIALSNKIKVMIEAWKMKRLLFFSLQTFLSLIYNAILYSKNVAWCYKIFHSNQNCYNVIETSYIHSMVASFYVRYLDDNMKEFQFTSPVLSCDIPHFLINLSSIACRACEPFKVSLNKQFFFVKNLQPRWFLLIKY